MRAVEVKLPHVITQRGCVQTFFWDMTRFVVLVAPAKETYWTSYVVPLQLENRWTSEKLWQENFTREQVMIEFGACRVSGVCRAGPWSMSFGSGMD